MGPMWAIQKPSAGCPKTARWHLMRAPGCFQGFADSGELPAFPTGCLTCRHAGASQWATWKSSAGLTKAA
eukprot:12484565-Alexandrium_andersonii.AAC.1